MVYCVIIENRGYSSSFSFPKAFSTIRMEADFRNLKPETQFRVSGPGSHPYGRDFSRNWNLSFQKGLVRCPFGRNLSQVSRSETETWNLIYYATSDTEVQMVVRTHIRWLKLSTVKNSLVQALHSLPCMFNLIRRNREAESTLRSRFQRFFENTCWDDTYLLRLKSKKIF